MKKLGIILFLILLLFANSSFAAGDSAGLNLNPQLSLSLNPLDAIKGAGVGVDINAGDVLDAFKLNFPSNLNNINIDTNIPISPRVNESQGLPDINLRQFLTPKDVSSDDLGKAVKAIATLVIEIFLVVISITSQMLKLMLGFLR